MNEELQKALGELLSKANNGIDAAGDFLAVELPDVIQQLLMWHGMYSFIMFIVGFLLLTTMPITLKSCLRVKDRAKSDYDNGEPWTRYDSSGTSTTSHLYDFIFIIYALLPIQIIIGLQCINLEWLQIYLAPKVWLLEYAAKLTN